MSETSAKHTNNVKEVVKSCMEEFVPQNKVQTLADHTPLITGGILDSITLVELVALLEDHYGVKFQTHEMSVDYFDTLTDIETIVQSKIEEQL